MSVASTIIARHFSRKTLKALNARGIVVISTTYVPDAMGDFTRGETAYNVDDNGCGRVWLFREVLAQAGTL